MELREKIGAVIDPRPWSGGRENSPLYKRDRENACKLADAILAIPEIRDALELARQMETPGAVMLIPPTPEPYDALKP